MDMKETKWYDAVSFDGVLHLTQCDGYSIATVMESIDDVNKERTDRGEEPCQYLICEIIYRKWFDATGRFIQSDMIERFDRKYPVEGKELWYEKEG